MESFHSIASRRIQEETIPEDEQVDTVRQHSRVAGGTPRASVFSQSYTETSQGLMAPNEHYNSLRHGINEQGDYECRTGDGLCIRLNPLDGSVSIYCVPDQHYAEIHPNCYAPAAMENVHLLHGGGSGTAVFFGEDPVLGPMVMKHAGPKDTREIFSLATISQELLKRNELDPHAVSAMRQRIPGFLMLYLSPYHLRDRGKELWSSLRGSFWKNKKSFLDNAKGETEVYKLSRESVMRLPVHFLAGDGIHGMRRIRVHRADEDTDTQITVCLTTVILEVPGDLLRDDCVIPDGLRFLDELADELIACQEEENWKVTLAQTTIGGKYPINGADVLTSGNMTDTLIDVLVENVITIMTHLRNLTLPEERVIIHNVRKEYEELIKTKDVSKVSSVVDSFVGSAIRKNFLPKKGRFAKMRAYGEQFRLGRLSLVPQEMFPAEQLGILLHRGSKMSDVYRDCNWQNNSLDYCEDRWLQLLEHAMSCDNPSATDCIWTCGLTDAGLHNTFLSQKRGLELFDLGAPGVMPEPAFLTKFLMSFFHTAGMQADVTHSQGQWVRRFDVIGGKLCLTHESQRLIPYLEKCFCTVLDRLVRDLFDDDPRVKRLLIKYVVLQLLSDAAFCLGRWEQKGGGVIRKSEKSCHLAGWLWRSLWDIYIASYVYNTFLVVT